MKKIIIITLAALALSVAPAFGNGENGGNGPHHNDHSHHNDNSETTITIDNSRTKTKVEGSTSIEEGEDAPLMPGSASAPGLTSVGTFNCLGSYSIGLSGPLAGVSWGKTIQDKNCRRAVNVTLLKVLGHEDAARSLLAIDPEVRAAFKANKIEFVALNPEPEPKSETILASESPDNRYMDHDYEVE